jgi:hypothetical protein
MYRLVKVHENPLAKNCAKRFKFGGKIKVQKSQKIASARGGAQATYLYT